MVPVSDEILKSCVAIGNFDGVHIGHRAMLESLSGLAKEQNCPAVVMTFDPHPLALLYPAAAPSQLTTIERRVELLREAGADAVIVLPVTSEFLQISAENFFDEVLRHRLQIRGLVEGPNFRFGRDRKGDVNLLQRLCSQHDIPLRIVDLIDDGTDSVSSSRIRQLLLAGHVAAANRLLGWRYRLEGTVVRGAGRGATIGFPTANISPPECLVPKHGVYAGVAAVDGVDHVAAVHIGPNPTFGEGESKIECWLDGFQGDLYGRILKVHLLKEVRDLQAFSDPQLLVAQIHDDVDLCRRIVQADTQAVTH